MPFYSYKAKRQNAETVMGTLNAQSEEDAIELIHQLGFIPMSVALQREAADKTAWKRKHVALREIYFFTRQLANLLKSGVTLMRALAIMEEQTQNRYFRQVISFLVSEVKNGRSFSESLSSFPKIFSSLYVTMVHAGEESGRLQAMLLNIAEYQKRQQDIRSKVRMAMAYPLFMGVIGLATIIFIFVFVLPRMSGLFNGLGTTLPLSTRALLYISSFIQTNREWIGFAAALTLLMGIRLFSSEKGKNWIAKLLSRIPLWGEIALQADLARFSRTMMLLMDSGVSLLRALQIAIPMIGHEAIQKKFKECEANLTAGGSFGESLHDVAGVPPMMGYMIALGEESGNLFQTFGDIADNYEQETDEKIKIMTTLLEPVMIIVVGAVVGFIVFSMLLPVFQANLISF